MFGLEGNRKIKSILKSYGLPISYIKQPEYVFNKKKSKFQNKAYRLDLIRVMLMDRARLYPPRLGMMNMMREHGSFEVIKQHENAMKTLENMKNELMSLDDLEGLQSKDFNRLFNNIFQMYESGVILVDCLTNTGVTAAAFWAVIFKYDEMRERYEMAGHKWSKRTEEGLTHDVMSKFLRDTLQEETIETTINYEYVESKTLSGRVVKKRVITGETHRKKKKFVNSVDVATALKLSEALKANRILLTQMPDDNDLIADKSSDELLEQLNELHSKIEILKDSDVQ